MLQLLESMIERAKTSGFHLKLLNLLLRFAIPFNAPHDFRIRSISDEAVEVLIPCRRKNFNHIRGIHACAMATASEFASGLALLSHLPASRYRLIMKTLKIEYFYQGKRDALARCCITPEFIQTEVLDVLKNTDKCLVNLTSTCVDLEGNKLCEAQIEWQLKEWTSVQVSA